MKKNIPFVLGLLVFFPFMNSCLVTFGDFPDYVAPWHTVEFYKSVSLSSGGTLSLENLNGNIEILGWEKDKVEVYAERNISFSSSRRAMWQPYGGNLPKIDIDCFEDIVKIKTSTVAAIHQFLRENWLFMLDLLTTGAFESVVMYI